MKIFKTTNYSIQYKYITLLDELNCKFEKKKNINLLFTLAISNLKDHVNDKIYQFYNN